MPRFSSGNVSFRIACSLGCKPPPPTPCKMRKKTSTPRLGARPQRNELTVNKATHHMYKALRPSNHENQPESGRTIALETRYEVRTQVDSSAPADKFPEMCGSATLAMEVSSTSMNVASVTVTAITQGLIEPSGIRNFASNLSFTARLFSPQIFLRCRGLNSFSRKSRSQRRSCRAAEPLSPAESDRGRFSPARAAQLLRSSQWRFPVAAG